MNEERTDPAHLRALAAGATPVPGDWYVPADAEAAFRAAVTPPVLLALLDRLERVEGALEDEYARYLGDTTTRACIGCIRQDAKQAQRAATWEEIRHLPGCALRGEP